LEWNTYKINLNHLTTRIRLWQKQQLKNQNT